METAIKFGDKIELLGFESVDKGCIAILRKMIGNAVREITEKNPTFQKITILLESANPSKVTIDLTLGDSAKKVTADGNNLFFALDKALKQL